MADNENVNKLPVSDDDSYENQLIALTRDIFHFLKLDFDDVSIHDDEHGNEHRFFILNIRGGEVLYDLEGQIWMNQANIAKVFNLAKDTVNRGINRYLGTKQGQRGKVDKLSTQGTDGRKIMTNFYDEVVISGFFENMRQNSVTDEAVQFLEERDAIIATVRRLIFQYSLEQSQDNQELLWQVKDMQRQVDAHLSEALEERILRKRAEQRAADAERDLEQHISRQYDDYLPPAPDDDHWGDHV